MNWGTKIFVAFVVFALIMATMVFVSVNQDINLVAEDYYQQEIEYEDQIDRIKNTRSLEDAPVIRLDRNLNSIVIQFSEGLSERVVKGEVYLFRPSDSRKDLKTRLTLNDAHQQFISLEGKEKGLWKVKLSWQDGEREYYDEKIIVY